MSLLGRRSLPVLLLAMILWSCEDPLRISLEDERNTDQFGVFYRDIVVPTTVYTLDSLITSSSDALIFGRTSDSDFGELAFTNYGELLLEFTNPPFDSAFYDSLVLELPLGYFQGEFPSQNAFEVYQLADSFPTGAQYNFSTVNTNPSPIGFYSKELDPAEDSVIRIKLDDVIGRDLFDKAVAGDTIFSSQTQFRNYFKGLQIKPGPANKAILGVSADDARMVMYYRELKEDGDSDTLNIRFLYERGGRFNNITTNWAGTSLEGITNAFEDYFPPDDRRFIQEGAGLLVKANIQGAITKLLDSLASENINSDLVLVNRADLRIGVETFDDFLGPPPEIRLVYTNDENRVKVDELGLLLQVQATYRDQLRNDFPLSIFYDTDQRIYNAEITGAVQAFLNAEIEEETVTIYPINMDRRANRFVFGKDNILLRLYLTIPN